MTEAPVVTGAIATAGVRLLLPPSEAKRAGGTGAALAALGFGTSPLARHRSRVASALQRLAQGRPSTAQRALGLPEGVVTHALAVNAGLLDAPTRPALDRYCGVVYEALDVASLDARQRAVADAGIVVFSGLFGVVRGDEPIPDYRVAATATLPRTGRLATFWRPVLNRHLPGLLGTGLLIDLRSTDYTSMWRPDAVTGPRVLTVRIRSVGPTGRLAVISFDSKRAKGALARAVVTRIAAGHLPTSSTDVAEIWAAAGLGDAEVGVTGLELVTAPRPLR